MSCAAPLTRTKSRFPRTIPLRLSEKGLEVSRMPLFGWHSAAKQGFSEPFRRLLRLQPGAYRGFSDSLCRQLGECRGTLAASSALDFSILYGSSRSALLVGGTHQPRPHGRRQFRWVSTRTALGKAYRGSKGSLETVRRAETAQDVARLLRWIPENARKSYSAR